MYYPPSRCLEYRRETEVRTPMTVMKAEYYKDERNN